MGQLNIQMTPTFEKNLKRYMKLRGVKTKSEAVRQAIEECLKSAQAGASVDFRNWIGMAAHGQNPHPRFRTHADVWEKG